MRRISAYDYLLLFVGTTSGAIMLLMTASLFSSMRALVLGLLLALSGAVLLREKIDSKPLFNSPDPWLIGCLLLALFFRENFSTNYIGGQDPGAYVNFSGIIEHFGGLYFPDAFRNTLPDALKQLYDRAPMDAAAQIWPLGDGLRFQAAWYPLHPGWMAIFLGLFGVDMHGLSMLLFSLLGVTGAYFLTLELAESDGLLAGRLAALLMAINPALCFMAKFPLTEAQTAALILNAGYLLAKGLKADGRSQLFLLASSFMLLVAYFFTRLSFPILIPPWVAFYTLSYSQGLDSKTARRLRAYLWMLGAAGAVAAVFYDTMLPMFFHEMFGLYWRMLVRHAIVAVVAAMVALAALTSLVVQPIRNQLRPLLEVGISFTERATPWLPLVIVLASIPSVLQITETGHLFNDIDVTPEPAAVRYHAIYRWMLAMTPVLWCLLLALPGLIKRQSALTIPLLFMCGTLVLTEVWAPSLPYLYYHVRYISSEIVPFSLVIISIVLATMWHSHGWRHYLAIGALLLAIPVMGVFSAVQLQGKEGPDPRFFHELDSAVAGGDVLILDEGDDYDVAVPIRYLFDKQLFVIPNGATPEQTRQIFDYLLKNSGSKYGRILLLSRRRTFRLPLSQTLERALTYTESAITNSEHWRFGGFQSDRPGRMILPYAWHSAKIPFKLYRVNAVLALDYRLSFGCPIDFSENGNSAFYIASGWSDQENDFRWTDGSTAVLHVRLRGAANAEALKHGYLDFQAASFGAQRVLVMVDGKQASELKLTADRRDYEIEVDLENPDPDFEHEIVFRLPDAHSPKSVGLRRDPRQLGIAMTSLTFFDSARTPGKCN